MKGLIYLYQRTIGNRIKKALKRPVTYVALVFILLYAAMICLGFSTMIEEGNLASPENLVTILSGLILLILPSNVISYSRRKGLLFRPSEVHFVFSAPVSPKTVLMFTGVKSFAGNILLGIAVFAAGLAWFHAGILKMTLYFLFFVIFESILEASIIIFCYGNETLPKKFFKILPYVMYAFMAIIAGIAVYLMVTEEPSFELIRNYFAEPVIQLVPIVGWNIAVTRLIFLGPDVINVIGTILFLASTIIMFAVAWNMKCTGAYYEDAMKFADDYKAAREKQKKGIVSIPGLEKRKKLKEATVEYKGCYAKAIYFRQMLEYKKNRCFIFGWNTLLCLGVGILIAVVGCFNDAVSEFGEGKIFIIPAVVAYVTLIFSGYATKWSKELENAYTYLIPDTALKKMWYATKIEHIRAIIDGVLVTLPGAVVFGISPVLTVLTVLLYVCLMANRLYYNMCADALLGNTLGNMGRSLVKVFLQGIAITFAIIAAAAAGISLGVEAGFFMMILVMGLLTFAGAAAASISFERMEVRD